MKLGLLYRGPNAILEMGRNLVPPNSHIFTLFSLLYPGEIAGTIDVMNPNFEMMKQFDALLYVSMEPWTKKLVEYIGDIPCTLIVNPDGSPEWSLRGSYDYIAQLKKVLDAADVVIISDNRQILVSGVAAMTETKVASWLFPMPVADILAMKDFVSDRYDIVLPYGPYRSHHENRGGYLAALAAQKIVEAYDCFNSVAVLNCCNDNHPDYEYHCDKCGDILTFLGCKDFNLLPLKSWRETIAICANARLVINLDWTPSIGRIAAECALVKTPYIGTGFPNFGHYLYGDICTVSPFDINSVVSLASLIDTNQWPGLWIDCAYEKALTLSLPNKAVELEGLICG